MALQIANPTVVAKVEKLARATGLTKTAVVEQAVDRWASEMASLASHSRLTALVAQFDRIPDRPDAHDPLEWDALGLPK